MKKMQKAEYERMEGMKPKKEVLKVVITDENGKVTLDLATDNVIMLATDPGESKEGIHAFMHGGSFDLYTLMRFGLTHMENDDPMLRVQFEMKVKAQESSGGLLGMLLAGMGRNHATPEDDEDMFRTMEEGHSRGLDDLMGAIMGPAHNCAECDHYDDCTLSIKKAR